MSTLHTGLEPGTAIWTVRRVRFWRRWLDHPEQVWLRQVLFKVHLWAGVALGLYVVVMSASGSAIVWRNELPAQPWMEWLVHLHADLLAGHTGRLINGAGSVGLTLISFTGLLVWWPGRRNWRRALQINRAAPFPRLTWDLHSALGFWLCIPLLIWGISGIYFAFPGAFDILSGIDPGGKVWDPALFWFAKLHFGRFGVFAQALWTVLGFAPAVLALSGIFLCCRRVMTTQKPKTRRESSSLPVPAHRL